MMTTRECFRRICNFEKAERIPNFEGGVTKKTIRDWHGQGLPEDMTREEFFGIDDMAMMRFINYGPVPGVEGATAWPGELMADGKTLFRRDAWGRETETVEAADDYAEHAFRVIRGGVRSRGDWEQLKGHFKPDIEKRYPINWDHNWDMMTREWENRDNVLILWVPSMIGTIKEMMGFEEYCMMLFDDLDLIEEIMEARTALAEEILPKAFEEVDWDAIFFWEDICYRNGPILPPDTFEKIASSRYKRIADLYLSMGGKTVMVDSDGDIRKLIPGWLAGGINHLLPLEPFANMDVVALRSEYGREFTMQGGIDKFCVYKGRDAIDRELDRIFPVVQDGGFIPHLDHQIDSISFDDYCYYMEKKKQMLSGV